MKTLVLPDVHHHTQAAEDAISFFQPDAVVFLGDYFDHFHDTPEHAYATALWLRESLAQPNRVHLWGNHDLPYAFPRNPAAWCPGFSEEKRVRVAEVLDHSHWAQLRVVHFLRPDLCCCHAGMLATEFDHPVLGLDAAAAEARSRMGLEALRSREPSILTMESGPLWLRWWNLPVHEQISQIVGHTVDRELRVSEVSGKFNVCLDTFGKYVGWFENDYFSVRETASGDTVWSEEADLS